MKEQDGLAAELAALDFTDQSRIKDALRERLLARFDGAERRGPLTTKEMIVLTLARGKLTVAVATALVVAALGMQLLWPGALPAAAQSVEKFINRVVLRRVAVSEVTPRESPNRVVTSRRPLTKAQAVQPEESAPAPSEPRSLPWKTVITAVPMRHTIIAQVPSEDMGETAASNGRRRIGFAKDTPEGRVVEYTSVDTQVVVAANSYAETVSVSSPDGQPDSSGTGVSGAEQEASPVVEALPELEKYETFEQARAAVVGLLDLREPGYLPEGARFAHALILRPSVSMCYVYLDGQVGRNFQLDELPVGCSPGDLKTDLPIKQLYINGEIGCLIEIPIGDQLHRMLKWQSDGISYNLFGSLPESEFLKIAESLTY